MVLLPALVVVVLELALDPGLSGSRGTGASSGASTGSCWICTRCFTRRMNRASLTFSRNSCCAFRGGGKKS